MSNLIASQKVMQHYLSALLTEEEPAAPTAEVAMAEQKKQQLNELLAQAVVTETVTEKVAKTTAVISPTAETNAMAALKAKFAEAEASQALQQRAVPVSERIISTVSQPAPPPPAIVTTAPAKDYRHGRFQALFFDVAGLKVAVPLKELGGIHQLGTINSLIGKPQWFKGMMLYREQKISIVDTARWVMPEKYDQSLQQKLNYQYVIMLGNSNWGLCCETLVNTYVLEQDDVKWREAEGKRPWMAGLIKKHMCVLLDVDAMIDLLNRGLDISA
ncbi:chemotaxis protein CheW [Rheinheimera hassiensis]|uniref:chemotaxis protein CheW n=1 Tax=Rheinheimera hassiensis TaxID=1193627 RepID=UPI001F057B47|nr:chemotaxis protein CheW [Rheinheimera hassiensis]